MKELSIEEKAKAYDDVHKKIVLRFGSNVAKEIFSEYEESEDEKIINTIRRAIEAKVEDLGNGVTKTACLAWIDRQGEQNSNYIHITQNIIDYINKHKEKFENDIPKLGDIWNVKEICTYPCVNNGKPVVEIENNKGAWMRLPLHVVYSVQGGSLILPNPSNNGKNEQKPTDKIESTAHDYITPNRQFFQWIYDRLKYVHNENPNVDYMLSLKERIENMQKSAWSEEDEEHIESILKRLDGMCKKGATFTETCFAVNQDMDWLKLKFKNSSI